MSRMRMTDASSVMEIGSRWRRTKLESPLGRSLW
jgi:hypothetical protein